VRRTRAEQPAHSRVIHDGNPAEEVFVQHRDGSYSSVIIELVNDGLVVDLRPSVTHLPRFKGAS